MNLKLRLLIITLFALSATAGFYPEKFKSDIANDLLSDSQLRDELRALTSRWQTKNNYGDAKKYLFNELHLKKDKGNHPYVHGVYCDVDFTENTPNIGQLGGGRVPNHQVVNCEHTWPQSRFVRGSDAKVQKGDLHHLFPTDSKANSTRSSNDFAEVKTGKSATRDCSASKSDGRYFEPPDYHKGNVARAMFYFAVRYGGTINSRMEAYLRKWHELDPVDEDERERNNKIERIQSNRNPFIDYPELVLKIKNF